MVLKRNTAIIRSAAAAGFLLASGAAASAAGSTFPDLTSEFDLVATVQHSGPAGHLTMDFNRQGRDGYQLRVVPQGMVLVRQSAAGTKTIATSPVGLPPAGAQLLVKRREGRIFVLSGHRLAMSVEDTSFSGGTAEITPTGGLTLASSRKQDIEPLYFTDDFMRQPDQPGDWNYEKGNWQIQTIGNVQRGANPFSLESRPDPVALATAGRVFWTDYIYEAAFKSSSDAKVGICADVQSDSKNYYQVRWSAGAKGALDLIKVVDGKPTLLAERKGGYLPNLWYRLGLRSTGGELIAEVDRQEVLSAHDTTFGQGKIGLTTDGAAGSVVNFDTILVHPSHFVYDDFGAGDVHHWQTDGDRALAGNPVWQDYTVTAAVTGTRTGAAIPFRFKDDKNYDEFAWDGTSCRLISVVNGVRQQLATSTHTVPVGETHQLQLSAEDGYLWATLDGRRIIEGVDFANQKGRAGFQPVTAGGSVVKSMTVKLADPPDPTDALTAEFTNVDHHKEMEGWAGPLHAWDPATFGNDAGYWLKGMLFGDTALKIPLIPQDLQDGQFAVILAGDGVGEQSGYTVDYNASTAGGISLDLYRLGKKVASGHLKAPANAADGVTLDITRRGSYLYAGIGKNIALRYLDPEPVDGFSLLQPAAYGPNKGGHSRLGLVVRGSTPLDIPEITISNPHTYAETFHLAPINWRPQSGDWTVTRRWACQPGWTWYGGKDSGYAANWYKKPISGDQSISYYTGAMMAAEADAGNEAWRDLNCSFCADGVNLFSGYTLVVCGWNGTVTRLFRQGKPVAESNAFYFPPQGTAHRLWFDVNIVKEGGNIKVVLSYYDESGQNHVFPLIDWTDPNPLQGGFVGYWTYDNGMMLARVELCYQQSGREPQYTADPVWLAQLPQGAPYPKATEAGLDSLPHPDITALLDLGVKPGTATPASTVASSGAHPTAHHPSVVPGRTAQRPTQKVTRVSLRPQP